MSRLAAEPVRSLSLKESENSIADLLQQLVAEVRALRRDLIRQRSAGSTLSRDDRAVLDQLLPVIGATFGSELFNSAEVCEREATGLRLVLGGLNVRQLGRLLRRAAGTPLDGYLVERQGTEAGATLWRRAARS